MPWKQYAIIPCVVGLMGLVVCSTYLIKNETNHQYLWYVTFILEASLLTANQMAWRTSFSPEINEAMLPFKTTDPTALFYFTELGWFVDKNLCARSIL
jgi:hypothetical protein